MKISELKPGDVVGVGISDIFGNAHRIYKDQKYVSATVTHVGWKWITVKTERNTWVFDTTSGRCKDLNEGVTLFATIEEAQQAAEKMLMIRAIRAQGFNFLTKLPIETVRVIYELMINEGGEK